jgi:hypothetical protein
MQHGAGEGPRESGGRRAAKVALTKATRASPLTFQDMLVMWPSAAPLCCLERLLGADLAPPEKAARN